MLQNLHTTRIITFKRSDFINTTPDNDRTISINGEGFRKILTKKIKELAVKRCQDMLKEWAKKEGDVRDQDYTVS